MINLYDLLYQSFPRQIAMPYRTTVNKVDFYTTINRFNGKKRLFSSIYNYVGNNQEFINDLMVDKIFFDFDGDNAHKNMMIFHNYLLEKDTKHICIFSGGGYHIYVFNNQYKNLINPKAALSNSHQYYLNEAKIEFDRAIFGDIARVATIPNTFNTKRKRFSIPLSEEDLTKGNEYISKLAKKQKFNFDIFGKTYFNISKYDTPENPFNPVNFEFSNKIKREIKSNKILKKLPPCISSMLLNGKEKRIGWRGRYLLIIYLRDYELLPTEVENLLLKYLITEKDGKTEGYHSVVEEKQVKYLFSNYQLTFPKCEVLKNEGYCSFSNSNKFCNKTKEYGEEHLVKIYK